MCDYRWATHQQSPAGTYWPKHGLICLPLSLGGQQHRTHSSTDNVGKGCYENKDYLCRKDLDIMMSLFNQVLALPASQEPRTISSSQLCQNNALRPRRTQTRLEQQTPSAHTSSQYLQLLPQLSQGREEQLPGRAGWRVILVGWAASTAPFRRNWALTLSWGSVCFLQGWRGSTQGRKCLSEAREHVKWKNSAEDSAVRSNVSLAEGGAIQRWKVKFDHFMQQLLPSLLIQSSCTVIFVQTWAGSSWLLAAHQCTKYNRHD